MYGHCDFVYLRSLQPCPLTAIVPVQYCNGHDGLVHVQSWSCKFATTCMTITAVLYTVVASFIHGHRGSVHIIMATVALYTSGDRELVHFRPQRTCTLPPIAALYTSGHHGPIHLRQSRPYTPPAIIALYTSGNHSPIHLRPSWPYTPPAIMALYTSGHHGPIHLRPSQPYTLQPSQPYRPPAIVVLHS